MSEIGLPLFKDMNDKNTRIEKGVYSEGKIFVNNSLYFDNVGESVWSYKIGGYAVLDKYLKSHKGEEIDLAHFQRMIQTLDKSLAIESSIAKIALC